MAEEIKKKASNFWTYVTLFACSIGYFGLYWLLMRETETCNASEYSISPNWFYGFWDQFFACRSINELGDALAGAFAPVAFIWLAGAVFIQSKELSAQREELNETQEVMKAQLDVAKQQVAETKASTALFKKQTEILEKEHLFQKQRMKDAEYDEFLLAASETLADMNYLWLKPYKMDSNQNLVRDPSKRTHKILDVEGTEKKELKEVLYSIGDASLRALDAIQKAGIKDGNIWHWSDTKKPTTLLNCLRKLDQNNELSDAYALRKQWLGISIVSQAFGALVIYIDKNNAVVSGLTAKNTNPAHPSLQNPE